MSFFNITYPHSLKNRDGAVSYDIPAKERCTEKRRVDKQSGRVSPLPMLDSHQTEVAQMLFEAKIQVLVAYMNEWDVSILSENLSDSDAKFLANIFMSPNPSYRKYQEMIKNARQQVPGYMDCQLSARIYNTIAQRKNQN
jgi:hypothetical protein